MKHTHLRRPSVVLILISTLFLGLTACSTLATSAKGVAAASTSSTTPQAVISTSTGSSLGVFSLLNEGTATGNSLTVLYGQSSEGDQLTTYWYAQPDVMEVVAVGNSQYEIMETLGGRCVTANGAAVSITTCAASSTQLFALNAQSDGSYVLQSPTGTCLNAAAAFTIVNAVACNASSADQRWKFTGATTLNLGSSTTGSTGTGTTTSTGTTTTTSSAPSGTNLGTFSMLDEATATGNSLTVLYGKSTEGDQLTTYWYGKPDVMQVISMGNSQYEIVENLGGRCVTTNGSAITINTCTGASGQLYALNVQSDGSYLAQSATGTCLNAPAAFTVVNAVACNASSPNQKWTFSGATSLNLGTSTTSTGTGTTTSGGTTTTGGTSSGSGSTSSGGSTTSTTATNMGIFSLLNEGSASGNSLAVLYGKSTEGDQLTTYWYSQPDVMEVLSAGNSQYEVMETLGNRCITATGAAITINTCAGASTQLYSFQAQSDGSYILQSSAGTCINAPAAFTIVNATTCNSSANQRWKFTGATTLNLGTGTSAGTGTTTPPTTTTAITNSSTVPAGYHLTFDDEFQTLSISDTNGAGTNWYTHTIQCCMSDTSNPSTPTYMAGIGDGAGKDPYSLISGQGLDIRLQKTNGAWYSGVISTVDGTGSGFSQQYGYFEMRAQFPAGLGTWPAFWLENSAHLSQSVPAGEIDVLEAYMQFPNLINTTLHDWGTGTQLAYHQSSVPVMSNGFHTYGMLWTATTMTFYCDGVTLWSTPTPSIMNQPYYPIIDLGLGGGWPTSQTPQQNDMIIQYMRVYSN